MWGEIAAAALNAAGGIASSTMSAGSSRHIARMQRQWEKEQAQNRIQWATQDALKAGINPAVAAGTAPNVESINPPAPDYSGIKQAGNAINTSIQLMQQQKAVDSDATLKQEQALSEGVKRGLMPKETAIKEMNAITERNKQQVEAQEAMARITRIMTLLPGENELQKQQTMANAMQLAVDQVTKRSELTEAEANQRVLEATGGILSLDDCKKLVTGIIGGAVYDYEKRQDRISAEKNASKNHRIREFNSRGKISKETYYEYAN